MHVNAGKITFLGALLALSVIFVYGGTVIESNTLFLIGAASFCMGIALEECGKKLGAGFLIATMLLTFFLIPDKMYCFTLGGMNLYLFLRACLKDKLGKPYRFVKYILFNIIFIPVLLVFPSFLYTGKINVMILIGLWLGGQVVFGIYDYVYGWFINRFWIDFRRRIGIK